MAKSICSVERERRLGDAWVKLDEARQILEGAGIELVTTDGHKIEIRSQMDRVFRLAKKLKAGNAQENKDRPAENRAA